MCLMCAMRPRLTHTLFLAIGSGGVYALAASRALIDMPESSMTAEDIARRAMTVAADICIYTNTNFNVCKLDIEEEEKKDRERNADKHLQ